MPDNIRVTYFDSAVVLIEVDGVQLLTDPVLDHAGSAFDGGPVHLEKTSTASVAPHELGNIDAVLLSHDQHGDILDRTGRAMLSQVARVLTTPEGASRLGGVAEGLAIRQGRRSRRRGCHSYSRAGPARPRWHARGDGSRHGLRDDHHG